MVALPRSWPSPVPQQGCTSLSPHAGHPWLFHHEHVTRARLFRQVLPLPARLPFKPHPIRVSPGGTPRKDPDTPQRVSRGTAGGLRTQPRLAATQGGGSSHRGQLPPPGPSPLPRLGGGGWSASPHGPWPRTGRKLRGRGGGGGSGGQARPGPAPRAPPPPSRGSPGPPDPRLRRTTPAGEGGASAAPPPTVTFLGSELPASRDCSLPTTSSTDSAIFTAGEAAAAEAASPPARHTALPHCCRHLGCGQETEAARPLPRPW